MCITECVRPSFAIFAMFLLACAAHPAWADRLSAIDPFNAAAYSGSTGSAAWSSEWIETRDNNSASSGLIQVVNGSTYCVAPNCLRLGGNNVSFSNVSLSRGINLAGASNVALTFSYKRQAINRRASGTVRVQASPDGITWTTVGTISFSSTTDSVFRSANYDISAMAATGTQIRFLGSGSDQRGYVFVDNVTVAFDGNVTPPPPDGNAGGAFKMAIPAYFRPGSYWVQLENGIRTVGLAVMNPGNGPGQSADQSYLNDIAIAQGRGTLVLGYAYTGYGQRSSTTVKNDISKYFQWYNVDGIFVDETSDRCSLTPYYQTIFSYVKSLKPSAKVAINPGNVTQECYAAVADIILNFEDIYSAYVSWRSMGWERNYPASKFWHLIYGTSAGNMPNAVSLAKSRNAGWIYVTPDTLPNPWDTLPLDPYWTNELNLIGQ